MASATPSSTAMAAATPSAVVDPARAAESNSAMIISVVTVFHVLALLFVTLRVYARAFVIKTFGRDDTCMVISGISALGGWIVFAIQVRHGLGHHEDTIPKPDWMIISQAGFWQSIISAHVALCFLKISIGFNLLRLSTSKWFRWCLWATIIFVIAYTFMGMMTFFLRCQPMEGYWNKALKPKCYPIGMFVKFSLVNTGFNIFTDVLFATFPIPIIWSLQMKRKLKLYLIGILSLGYFAVAMGIVKAFYQIAYGNQTDKTFKQSIQFWGFLQLQVGIIAACATSLKPLVSRMLNLSTDRYATPSKYGYGTGRSRGNRATVLAGTQTDDFPARATNEFEMERGMAGHDSERGLQVQLGNCKGEVSSTATSFYKHGSAEESGSEEMILSTSPVQPHSVPTEGTGRGIMKTTEVRVTVNAK